MGRITANTGGRAVRQPRQPSFAHYSSEVSTQASDIHQRSAHRLLFLIRRSPILHAWDESTNPSSMGLALGQHGVFPESHLFGKVLLGGILDDAIRLGKGVFRIVGARSFHAS